MEVFRWIPQLKIFINDKHVSGCDDMMALEAQGKLDTLLDSLPNPKASDKP